MRQIDQLLAGHARKEVLVAAGEPDHLVREHRTDHDRHVRLGDVPVDPYVHGDVALAVSAEHPRAALWAYEAERLPPTAQIVRMNRVGGPEGVIDAVDERAPDGFTNIDDVLTYEQRKAIVRGYAGVAGFAQSQVNTAAGKAA